MERRSVVLGSNCFTGSHFVDELLRRGWTVFGLSRSLPPRGAFLPYHGRDLSRFAFLRLDMAAEPERLLRFLDEVEPELVVQVAAVSEVELSNHYPLEYYELNTLAVVRLAEHLRSRSYLRRFLHISSAEVFGPCLSPVGEDHPFRPSTPYAVSKAAADMHLGLLVRHGGFPAVVVRSTNVYGPHQQLYKIIPRAVIHLKLGRTIELHGGGSARKSFIHIRDVVRGALLALEHGRPGAYHFSVPSEDTVADCVRFICRRAGRDFEACTRAVGDRLAQDSRYWLDCTRAERELGWSPQVPFAQGVEEVMAWVEEEWDELIREPLVYSRRVKGQPAAAEETVGR